MGVAKEQLAAKLNSIIKRDGPRLRRSAMATIMGMNITTIGVLLMKVLRAAMISKVRELIDTPDAG